MKLALSEGSYPSSGGHSDSGQGQSKHGEAPNASRHRNLVSLGAAVWLHRARLLDWISSQTRALVGTRVPPW